MAPKGGRGGGGRGGFGSVDLDCSENAFYTTNSKVLIAFGALFLVFYLVLACLIPGKKKRTNLNLQPKKSWMFLSISIWLQVLGTILLISYISLVQCGNDGGMETQTARMWFDGLALLGLFGIILVSLCKDMHQISGSFVPKLVAIGHWIYFGFLALLKFLSLAIASAILNPMDSANYNTAKAMFAANKGLTAAFNVFALIGMGVAAASMLMAVLRSSQLKQGGLMLWLILLIGGSISLTLVELGFGAASTLRDTPLKPEADLAYYVLRSLTYGIAFMAALFILKNHALNSEAGQREVPAATAVPQQEPLMNYNQAGYNQAGNPGFNPNVNTSYAPQYDPNAPNYQYDPQPIPSPATATYSAPYNGTSNVNYTPVSAAPPGQNQNYYQ